MDKRNQSHHSTEKQPSTLVASSSLSSDKETSQSISSIKKLVCAALASALLALIGAIGLIIWVVQNHQTQQTNIQKLLMRVQDELAGTQPTLQQQQQSISALKSQVDQNLQSIHQLNLQLNAKSKTWLIGKARYLLEMAQNQLQYTNDTQAAIQLLNDAQQVINSLQDPQFAQVLQTLNQDLTVLKNTPKIDIPGLIGQIQGIQNQIPRLPLIPSTPLAQQDGADAAKNKLEQQKQSWWSKLMNTVGGTLKDMVVIRHQHYPIAPLLPPPQQAYLIQNIQSQLGLAQWAVAEQQPELYTKSLQQAMNWIGTYFNQNDPLTKNILASLAKLQQEKIKVEMPNVLNTLNALKSVTTE